MSENHFGSKSTQTLIRESLNKAISYQDYRALVNQLALEGKSTGVVQTEALSNYTLLNDRRMKRFDKTVKIDETASQRIAAIQGNITLLVLTESWCGDASPSLPVMHKISELNQNVSLHIVLRDENIELMNLFLTNGGMSIPKLIAIDGETQEVLFDWGPRSKAATRLVEDYKTEHGELTAEFKQDLQVWYNKDKGKSVMEDLTSLLLKNVGNGSFL